MRRTPADKAEAARTINEALVAGWAGFEIAERLPLEEIAAAHERVESRARPGFDPALHSSYTVSALGSAPSLISLISVCEYDDHARIDCGTLMNLFEHMPDVEITAGAEFRWILGGAFMIMASEVSHPQAPDGYSIRS